MLEVFDSLKNLNFQMLMDVYAQSNRENAEVYFPQLSEPQGVAMVEQQFYTFLQEVFFKTRDSRYCVWLEDGKYVSALRLEPYRDGLLLEALETAPEQRHKGYGRRLMQAALGQIQGKPVYSHVGKRNAASLALHMGCGFEKIQDCAVYIDGSVSQNAVTLKRMG